jgi:hypothetical protein
MTTAELNTEIARQRKVTMTAMLRQSDPKKVLDSLAKEKSLFKSQPVIDDNVDYTTSCEG